MSVSRLTLFLSFILLACVPAGVYGQLKCKIEHYSTEDGLSHDGVTCIVKDHEGFMWFGTWDGINRFDGHHFVSYKSAPGDMSRFKNDRIDQIVEDQTNHLWLKGYDNNIYRFDKRTEHFELVADKLTSAGHKQLLFEKIFETQSGDVWLVSKGKGLVLFPKNDTTLNHFTFYTKEGDAAHQLPSNTVSFYHQDDAGNIWIGTPAGLAFIKHTGPGVYRSQLLDKRIVGPGDFRSAAGDDQYLYFSTSQGQLITYQKKTGRLTSINITPGGLNRLLRSKSRRVLYGTTASGEILTVDITGGRVSSRVNCNAGGLSSMYEDKSGNLWVAPDKGGIIRYAPGDGSLHWFTQVNDAKYNANGDRFRVFEDNNGVVWASLKGGGFGWYNAAKGSFEYFYNEPGSPTRQFSNIVMDFYYDASGILWLNTEDRGIEKVTFQRNDFNQQLLVDPARFKSDNEVRGICYDRNGRLWLGVKSGKLYIYEKGKLLNNLFINEPAGGMGLVYAILQDSRGNIWLGTKANGLFMASPEGGHFRLRHFLPDKNDKSSISSNEIYALLEDKQGRVWAGSYDGGLNLIKQEGGHINFDHAAAVFSGYPKNTYQKIRHMALDNAGRLWVATTDGLLVGDINNPAGKFVAYSKIPGDKQSLGNNDIQFIYRDTKGQMWLATSGGGIDQAVGADPMKGLKFKNYSTKDGLANDYALSCTEDSHRNLWIATLNGLSRFNIDTHTFRNYNSYDGLPKAGFSEASCVRLPDNRLVFGTIKGYLSFDPDKISIHRTAANMVLTNLQVNSRDITTGTDTAILNRNFNYTGSLTLNHNQNNFSIDYTVLDQRSGLKQAYAYRLQNFDQAWRNNQTQRRATYTNLSPGKYLFEIKSLNTDLYIKQPYRSLQIIILPPWWQTWWAYLLYAIVVAVISVVIRKNALTMLHLRQNVAVEKRMAELKMTFFTNVSHELRTPLTLILNPIVEIEKILKRERNDGPGLAYIKVVKRNAGRMVRFINQLLDMRKVENGNAVMRISKVELISFVSNILTYFKDVEREKGIELVLATEKPQTFAWIDTEKMDIVLYNVLANAFKFTPADKKIVVKIREQGLPSNLIIDITDQGPGVPIEKLSAIFDMFYEAGNNETKNVKGTGIGLAFSKELVELHKGQISARNNPDGGLTVRIELPAGNQHFNASQVIFTDEPAIGIVAHEADAGVPLSVISQSHGHGPAVPLLLLVEDNAELRSFLSIQLSELYRVETAANGEEGLRKANELLPDLILSDVMMPVMDGLEMLDKLKNTQATSHIPVIILSARHSVENQVQGLKYGADYYITKPFQNEFLLAAVQNLLDRRRRMFDGIVEQKTNFVDLGPSQLVITSKDEAFLKQVVEVVEKGMANPEFQVDEVAESMGMGRTTFFTKFKSLTNLAPVEFVRDMRLKRGLQHLDAGETNISVIAYTVGFNNARYFSTCFKEKYKVSPSEYIRQKAEKAK
ncbi:response regulator [Mucilaginibacter mali]|uniref:histidine kinase n=1 Tax=Mucilaginibacter mali TaxID=2740462 RepID=A0A7D4PUK0_9SPHI|nr:two-component regulator propeller domain-containing protein [Mucilaginibacter mali]QKJ30768.1 response regulator [Mucilaginibacter mali]